MSPCPLGVDLAKRGASSAGGLDGKIKTGGRKTVYDYAVGVKALHPHKVRQCRLKL